MNEFAEFLGSPLTYFNQSGAAFLENSLSFSFLLCIPIAIICELADSYRTSQFFISVAGLFVWGYTLSLLLGFQKTGPFVIMVYKMIVSDVFRFLVIYLVILMGYTCAMYAVAPSPEWGADEYNTVFYGHAVRLMISMLGGIDFDANAASADSTYTPWVSLLYTTYIIVITILLLNMLIAMMGDTFNTVKEQSREEWHLCYAQIIFSIESELGDDYFHRGEGKYDFEPYWTTINGKRFLQVQETNANWYTDVAKLEEETAAVVETLKSFDTDMDGKISMNELEAGVAQLQSDRKELDLLRSASREPERADRSTDKPPVALGPQDNLPGRLDDRLTQQTVGGN